MMEAGLYFSFFVFSMCAMHLISTASRRLEGWRLKQASPKKAAATKIGQVPQADDWYVFFHCADLVGEEPKAGKSAAAEQANRTVAERNVSRPRISARR
jgi:hypothetical protein